MPEQRCYAFTQRSQTLSGLSNSVLLYCSVTSEVNLFFIVRRFAYFWLSTKDECRRSSVATRPLPSTCCFIIGHASQDYLILYCFIVLSSPECMWFFLAPKAVKHTVLLIPSCQWKTNAAGAALPRVHSRQRSETLVKTANSVCRHCSVTSDPKCTCVFCFVFVNRFAKEFPNYSVYRYYKSAGPVH